MTDRITRRGLLKAAGAAGAVGTTIRIPAPSRAADPETDPDGWPQHGHGPANSGFAPDGTGPTGGVDERWRFKTGGAVHGSPAVTEDAVYVPSAGDTDGNGRKDGNVVTLYALGRDDGNERWRFRTDRPVFSSPAVVDGTVYVGDVGGTVYAVAAGDGTERWRFRTGGRMVGSPTVVDDTIYVGTEEEPGTVHALAVDGSERWRFRTDSSVTASPAVVDGTVYVADARTVYALDADDGSERWRYEGGRYMFFSSPAVVDGTVYVTGNYDVYALAADDGSEQWRFGTGGGLHGSPAVADGTVYVGSDDGGHADDGVYALAADDGSERWRFRTDSSVTASPAVVDGTVYVGANDTNVYALAADDGSERWRFRADHGVGSPAVADGTVYVGSDDGHVYALREGSRRVGSAGFLVPGTDRHLWEWEAGLGIASLVGVGLLSVGLGKARAHEKRALEEQSTE